MGLEEQRKEIATIAKRNVTLSLSDADCDRLARLCEAGGITVSTLLENFIGDLVDGTYSNGSDERELARGWYNRCGFGMFSDKSLLPWLHNYCRISVEAFVDLLDDIECGYADLEDYKKDPSVFDEEEIEFLKSDIEELEKERDEYKSEYLKDTPDVDWDKEVEAVKRWYKDILRFKDTDYRGWIVNIRQEMQNTEYIQAAIKNREEPKGSETIYSVMPKALKSFSTEELVMYYMKELNRESALRDEIITYIAGTEIEKANWRRAEELENRKARGNSR